MNRLDPKINFESEPSNIPVLTTVIPKSEVSDDFLEKMNSLEIDKANFMASSEELLKVLRPEIDKLASKLVEKSLQLAWLKRSKPNSE